MNDPIIGTGFWANKDNYEFRIKFLDIWLKNTGDRDVIIVDNNEISPLKVDNPRVRVIRSNNNAGHPDDFKGKFRPHLLGYSIGWITPAILAYAENRDYVYKEQDCLWFGDIIAEFNQRADLADVVAQIGYAKTAPSKVESCLFWIRHEFITEFVTKYMEQPEGDGLKTSEEKMEHIAMLDNRVVPVGFGVGRDRPLPIGHPIWYAQRVTQEELDLLSSSGLI